MQHFEPAGVAQGLISFHIDYEAFGALAESIGIAEKLMCATLPSYHPYSMCRGAHVRHGLPQPYARPHALPAPHATRAAAPRDPDCGHARSSRCGTDQP